MTTAEGAAEPEGGRAVEYALLIYTEEPAAAPPEELMKQEMAAYDAFTRELTAKGANKGGEALQGTQTATTVRVRNGETLTTDGPFAETKEALGGFYLVEAKDLDEAIKIASMIPGAQRGSIEIRPVWQLPEGYGDPANGRTAETAGAR
jgi:hypothetical protein